MATTPKPRHLDVIPVRPVREQEGHGLTQEVRDKTLFAWIPVQKMFVDSYGRTANTKKVDRLVATFDWNALGTILVSMRDDDTYAIIDGHHRYCAACIKGYEEMPCRVFIDLTFEQEADLYLKFNTVNQQSALDKFRARLQRNDLDAVMVQSILRIEGLDIAFSGPGPGKVMAVSALDQVYAKSGSKVLSASLRVLKASFGDATKNFTGSAIQGAALFMDRYLPVYDEHRLVMKLKEIGVEGLRARSFALRAAVEQGRSDAVLGQAMRLIYNEGLRLNKLPEWNDRSTTTKAWTDFVEKRRATWRESKQKAAERKRMKP